MNGVRQTEVQYGIMIIRVTESYLDEAKVTAVDVESFIDRKGHNALQRKVGSET